MGSGLLGLFPSHRKVFFSFDYDRDAMKAAQIRQAGEFAGRDAVGFVDWANWETVKHATDERIRRWIDDQLDGASVTAVLIGDQTAQSRWVRYEIQRSIQTGKGLLGIYIDKMNAPGIFGRPHLFGVRGPSPFAGFPAHPDMPLTLADLAQGQAGLLGGALDAQVRKYCWVDDRGHENIRHWIEMAAMRVGR